MKSLKTTILTVLFILMGISTVWALPAPNVGYIYIGDSRFLYMDRSTNYSQAPNVWDVAVEGEGYCWLSTTGVAYVDNLKATNPQITTWYEIYGLGVNDLASIDYYVNFYKQRALKANVILVSVNPVGDTNRADNATIEAFNQRISQAGLPYIDTYSYLTKTWYSTYDGVHYTADTDVYIYNTLSTAIDNYTDALVVPGKK